MVRRKLSNRAKCEPRNGDVPTELVARGGDAASARRELKFSSKRVRLDRMMVRSRRSAPTSPCGARGNDRLDSSLRTLDICIHVLNIQALTTIEMPYTSRLAASRKMVSRVATVFSPDPTERTYAAATS